MIPDDVLPGFGMEADAVTADVPAPPTEPPEPEPAAAPPASPTDDAVFRALEAQRNAERIQAEALRQHQPIPQQQHQVQPSLSERRRAFIAQHPELVDPVNQEAVMGYWRQALRMGIPDDTGEIDNYVQRALAFELSSRAHRDEPREPEPQPAPPPSRRSMPMAAPVSRGDVSMSGRPSSSRGRVTLTEEERAMARVAIPDRPDMPKLSDLEKEYLYAQNKQKYQQMLADGSYSDQGGRK